MKVYQAKEAGKAWGGDIYAYLGNAEHHIRQLSNQPKSPDQRDTSKAFNIETGVATWSPWLPWLPCSQTCNQGPWKASRTRDRLCSVQPLFGKDQCVGTSTDVGTCDDLPQCEDGNYLLHQHGGELVS